MQAPSFGKCNVAHPPRRPTPCRPCRPSRCRRCWAPPTRPPACVWWSTTPPRTTPPPRRAASTDPSSRREWGGEGRGGGRRGSVRGCAWKGWQDRVGVSATRRAGMHGEDRGRLRGGGSFCSGTIEISGSPLSRPDEQRLSWSRDEGNARSHLSCPVHIPCPSPPPSEELNRPENVDLKPTVEKLAKVGGRGGAGNKRAGVAGSSVCGRNYGWGA